MAQQPTEEQIKAFQEKIKNMTPEQLKEFQKQNCIFCKIVQGQVASKKVYEDEKCIAILDINPANPGHILLMPKEHYALMPMIPDEDLGHISMVAKVLSHVMLNKLGAEGTNIFIANGVAAGQRSQHFMMHVIPRKEGDGVNLEIPENKMSAKDIEAVKKAMLAVLPKVMPDYKPFKLEVKEKPKEEVKEEKAEEKETPKEIKKEENPEKKEVPNEEKKETPKEVKKEEKKEAKKPKKEKKVNKSKEEDVSLDDIASLFK